MPVQARVQGQYVQPGTIVLIPEIANGALIPIDGFLELDAVYLQADYPVLFGIIGIFFNDPLKGDNPATQFRTPSVAPPEISGCRWMVRY